MNHNGAIISQAEKKDQPAVPEIRLEQQVKIQVIQMDEHGQVDLTWLIYRRPIKLLMLVDELMGEPNVLLKAVEQIKVATENVKTPLMDYANYPKETDSVMRSIYLAQV